MTVLLTPWLVEDAPHLTLIANNINIWNNLRDRFPFPYTMKDARLWIAEQQKKKPQEHMVIRADGKLVGSIGILLMDDVGRLCAEIGYFVGEPFWNKGIATDAVEQMTEYVFKNFKVMIDFAHNPGGRHRTARARHIRACVGRAF